MANTVIERRFPSRLEDFSRVAAEVNAFLENAGISGRAAYVANLALEELGTNILKYGYDDTAVHEILLRVDLEPTTLRLMLEDDGQPFNPLHHPEPDVRLRAEDRVPGGLGIHLVRKLADGMDYRRCEGRNRVIVQVRIGEERQPAPP